MFPESTTDKIDHLDNLHITSRTVQDTKNLLFLKHPFHQGTDGEKRYFKSLHLKLTFIKEGIEAAQEKGIQANPVTNRTLFPTVIISFTVWHELDIIDRQAKNDIKEM